MRFLIQLLWVTDMGFLIQLLWERLEVAIGHHLAQIWSYGVLNPVIVGNGCGVLDPATVSEGWGGHRASSCIDL